MATRSSTYDGWRRYQQHGAGNDGDPDTVLFEKIILIAISSGISTYLMVTGSLGFVPKPRTVLVLLILNLVVLLARGTLVIRRLVVLFLERRRGKAGAQLHSRLVLLFGLVAITPAIIVAVFSAVFLNRGIEAWFSDRVRTAVKDSLIVARSYLA